MKKIIYTLFAIGLASFASNQVSAATFTAVTSGNFSAASTWSGGIAPTNTLNDDIIIIGSGFVVNLDMNVTMDETPIIGTSSFQVDGTLNSSNNSDITMLGGDFTGSGTVNIDRLTFEGLSTMSFTGMANLSQLDNNVLGLLLAISGDVNVSDTLFLSGSILSLDLGSDFDFGQDAVVKVTGGAISLNGGILNNTFNYDVIYAGNANITTGIEASGTGMRDLMLDLSDNTMTLTLGSDIVVNGDLMLESGTLDLGASNLTLMGDFQNNSGLNLTGSQTAGLTIMSSSALTDDISFNAGEEQLGTLTINTSNNTNLSLGSDLEIFDELTLESGDLNIMTGNNLTLAIGSTIRLDQGSLNLMGGTFDGTADYNVEFFGQGNVNSGLELSGSGLQDVMINLNNPASSVSLSSDFTSNGGLDLQSGDLDLNGNDLFINGTFNSTSTGTISSDNTSNIEITSTTSILDNINFNGSQNTVNDLTLNLGTNNSDVTIGSNLNVAGNLNLESGDLNISNGSTLTVMNNSTITIDQGSLNTTTGTFDGSASYDVEFIGQGNVTSGAELTGTGLNNVMIDLDDATTSVTLNSDFASNGNLNIESGELSLNGNDLTLNGTFTSTANGTINSDANSDITIETTGNLGDELFFSANGNTVNTLNVNADNNGNIMLGSDLTVQNSLNLENGDFSLMNGSVLDFGNAATITIDQGQLVATNGSFNGTTEYNVEYVGAGNISTGLELTGSGLDNISLMLDDDNTSVTLTSDLTSNGSLNLMSGNLVLNMNDLTIAGDFASELDGRISSDINSDITINTNGSLNDTLNFASNANQAGTLTLDLGTQGGEVVLGSDLTTNNIVLTNGSIVVVDNELELASTGTITGADEDNFIIIDGDGTLSMEVITGNNLGTTFPVGTMNSFAPANIVLNSGTTNMFSVNTVDGVMAQGTTGNDIALTTSMVDRTWNITSAAGSTTDIDLTLMWDQSMEVNGFDRTDAQITHFTSGSWDMANFGSATTNASGMFELTRTDILSLSPFAVADRQAVLSIEENATLVSEIYPNPASGFVNVDLNLDRPSTIQVLDASGRLLTTQNAAAYSNNKIDLNGVSAGVFYIKVISDSAVETVKVVKR